MCRESKMWNKYGWIVFLLIALGYIAIGSCLMLTSFMAWYVLCYFPFMTASLGSTFPFGNFASGVTGIFAFISGIFGCYIGCTKKLNRRSPVIDRFLGCSVFGVIMALYSMALNLFVVIVAQESSAVSNSGFVGETKQLLDKMNQYNDVYYNSLLNVHWCSAVLNFSYFILQ